MNREPKYKYVRYDKTDDEYFGCKNIIHDEWEYIHKRRGTHNSEQLTAEEESNIASVTVKEIDTQGNIWTSSVQLFVRIRRLLSPAISSADSVEHETKAISTPPDDLTGIALSGGGIRSASFSLGILQALAYSGWLKKLDYMSTVSGGGYIGGSLSWLLHRKWKGEVQEEITYGLDRKTFPYSSYPMVGMDDKIESTSSHNTYKGRMLRHLRQHARFLTPGNGINIMSLLAVIFRNTFFSLFVYGGLLSVIFAIIGPYIFGSDLSRIYKWLPSDSNNAIAIAYILGLAFLLAIIIYVFLASLLPRKASTGYNIRYFYEKWMGYLLTCMIILAILGALPFVDHLLDSRTHEAPSNDGTFISGTMGDITFTGAKQITIKSNIVMESDSQPTSHDEAKSFSWNWFISQLSKLKEHVATVIGFISTLLAAIASILAFFQVDKSKKALTSLIVFIGSVGLILGLLLLTYHASEFLRIRTGIANDSDVVWNTLETWPTTFYKSTLVDCLVILLVIFLFTPDLNFLSIHRYYRDRLMETFTPDLPDAINVSGPVPGALKSADHTHLYELLDRIDNIGSLGPYHIINTNIVLVSSNIPKFRARGGDNFILTPLYCGSNATGWCESKSEHSPYNSMTLPTAIAISGASINSNTGSGGEGSTRSPWLSLLMGFFNIRLGYWAVNPKPNNLRLNDIAEDLDRPLFSTPERNDRDVWGHSLTIMWYALKVVFIWPLNRLQMLIQHLFSMSVSKNGPQPHAFYPGLMEVYFRKNLDENSHLVQLSDGGHFENLGLYELVRRRLRLIIICDGTADPDYSFKDLANAIEKVRADFGALITFKDIEQLLPSEEIKINANEKRSHYYSNKGYLVGKIIYKDRTEGTILYLNTTFFPGLSADIYGYRMSHEEFPDQPTSDQFFDEKQFEAYRELGYQLTHSMMCDADMLRNNPIITNLMGTPDFSCLK